MSEAIIFENMPYNLFLKQRMEFVVICQDHLAANIMRVVEAEMIRLKEGWQARAEKALEEKKKTPREPRTWWVRLSLSQIIARLYMYDSAKLKKPESEDMDSPEWVEYRMKKALSISKGTLRKAVDLLISKGFLIERSKPGDEFGAPIWTLHKENVQKALKALPENPFTIFHSLGGGSEFECGGEVQNLNVPPTNSECGEMQNLNVPPTNSECGEMQNLNVDIDSSIDPLLDNEIDLEEEGTYGEHESQPDDSATASAGRDAHAQSLENTAYRPELPIASTSPTEERIDGHSHSGAASRDTTRSGRDNTHSHLASTADLQAGNVACGRPNSTASHSSSAGPAGTDSQQTSSQVVERINTVLPVVESEMRRASGALVEGQQCAVEGQPFGGRSAEPARRDSDGYEKSDGEEAVPRMPAVRSQSGERTGVQLSALQASYPQQSAKVEPPAKPEQQNNAVPAGRRQSARRNKEPDPIVLSREGQKVWDAWGSIFKVSPELLPSNADSAEKMVEKARVWCPILHFSLAEFLRDIKDHAYKTSGEYYRKRGGVKLYDIPHEFEGWQSMKTEELDRQSRATAKPTAETPTVSGLKRWVAPGAASARA